ncbi:hypothetical protein OPT61_g7819 [Boeremia exigua]|uniref:Uncharacterized protein n=1 Tax=Boeremia exigua TaxID=749465 RepID=A0ACC2I0P3_9PLEO|nr:hypothetical protein OPT61_g7819 [Boeremia exigua]
MVLRIFQACAQSFGSDEPPPEDYTAPSLNANASQASSLNVSSAGVPLHTCTHHRLGRDSSNLREHAGLCAQKHFRIKTAYEAGQRRMTLTNTRCGSGPDLQASIPMFDLAQPTIPFKRLPLPDSRLLFLPRPSMLHSRKRGRAAADIDGEHSCLQKKKRRLRLFLITSRLSPQFSHPATNIVDRGSSKIAVWAKQKAAGRNLLPKAAVLNRIRRGAVAARDAVSRRRLLVEQEKEQQQLELARLTFNYGAIHTYTRPVHLPTEPLPLATVARHGHLSPSGSPTGSPSSSPTTSLMPLPQTTRAQTQPTPSHHHASPLQCAHTSRTSPPPSASPTTTPSTAKT